MPTAIRIKDKDYKPLNDKIYNLPMFKCERSTEQGRGTKAFTGFTFGKNVPAGANYNITSLFDDNIKHNRGYTMLGKSVDPQRNKRYLPGVGTYNIDKDGKFGNIGILVKSRQGFFYDDDMKKKKHTVSMQRYKPVYTLVERNRFDGVGFGYGGRFQENGKNSNPGPGSYKIIRMYDQYPFKKTPIN